MNLCYYHHDKSRVLWPTNWVLLVIVTLPSICFLFHDVVLLLVGVTIFLLHRCFCICCFSVMSHLIMVSQMFVYIIWWFLLWLMLLFKIDSGKKKLIFLWKILDAKKGFLGWCLCSEIRLSGDNSHVQSHLSGHNWGFMVILWHVLWTDVRLEHMTSTFCMLAQL